MKINKVYEVYGKHIDTSVQKNNKEKDQKMNTQEIKSVDVQISKSAKELARKIEESRDQDFSQKVEKIRQNVLDGKYKVSSERLADKILDSIESQEDNKI